MCIINIFWYKSKMTSELLITNFGNYVIQNVIVIVG